MTTLANNTVTVSLLTSIYVIVFPMALAANITLIYIILKRPNMKSTINHLFVNMAIANLLVVIFIMPDTVRYLFVGRGWFGGIFGEVSCRVVNFAYAISIAASILSLTAISLDQFYAIFFPMKRIAFVRKRKLITAVIWASSLLAMSPYLAFYAVREIEGQTECVYVFIDRVIMKAHFSCVFVFFYAFPLVLMGTFYVLIGNKLWFRTVPGDMHSVNRQATEQTKRRAIRTLTVVIATFALCWLPVQVFHMCAAFEPEMTRNMTAHWAVLIVFIAHTNSAINPCLVIALNGKFRSEFRQAWNSGKNRCRGCLPENEQSDRENGHNNKFRFKYIETFTEGIAMKRGRFYDMGAEARNYCPNSISLVQFSYYNNGMESNG